MKFKQTPHLAQLVHSLHALLLALVLPALLVTVSCTFTVLYCSSQPSIFSQQGFCSAFNMLPHY